MGLLLRIPIWNRPHGEDIYEDEPWWRVEEGAPKLAPIFSMLPGVPNGQMAYEASPAITIMKKSHMHSLVQ